MAAPVNTVAPAITGTIEVGETLTCSTGTWTGGVQSYVYAWYRAEQGGHAYEAISGATDNTYIVSSADSQHTLRCTVTATNNTGSTAANSNETATIPEDWFIVETGSIVAGAVSYCTVGYADDYHARRSNTAWTTASNGAKKAALVKATDYTVQVYRNLWQGWRVSQYQVLDWPRSYVAVDTYAVDYQSIPNDVKDATAELALRAITADLTSDTTQQKRRVKVGPIETEYDTSSSQQKRYARVTGMLAPYLKYAPGTVRAVRA